MHELLVKSPEALQVQDHSLLPEENARRVGGRDVGINNPQVPIVYTQLQHQFMLVYLDSTKPVSLLNWQPLQSRRRLTCAPAAEAETSFQKHV